MQPAPEAMCPKWQISPALYRVHSTAWEKLHIKVIRCIHEICNEVSYINMTKVCHLWYVYPKTSMDPGTLHAYKYPKIDASPSWSSTQKMHHYKWTIHIRCLWQNNQALKAQKPKEFALLCLFPLNHCYSNCYVSSPSEQLLSISI
jgi:hypothetical protein